MKQKTCKICKEKFTPTRQLQPTCTNIECQVAYADKHLNKKRIERAKSRRKELKEFNATDINIQKRKTQDICNEYIRLRDAKEPCISCLKPANAINKKTDRPIQFHAGHFKPKGTYSAIRFDERNIHKQCSTCNVIHSANLSEYRPNLIKKVGLEVVEELEASTQVKRWTLEELKEIQAQYKFKIKQLKGSTDGIY